MSSGFTALNKPLIEKAKKEKWLGDNYSDRLWLQKESLLDSLNTTFLRGLALGENPRVIARNMRKEISGSYDKKTSGNFKRLARTEFMHIANEATMDGYGEHGVERYQWLAAEDERTCEICGALDGQKFKLKGLTKDENYGIINIPSGATIEELENFAKEKWSVDKIDITGLDPDAVGGTFEAMEQYPQLRNRIIEIRQYERAIMGVASNF